MEENYKRQMGIRNYSEGYKLEFLKKPAFRGIKHTCVPPDQIGLISLEIESLLKKKAIEKVSTKDAKAGF